MELTAGPTALPIADNVTAIPFNVPRRRNVGEELVSNIVLQGNAKIPLKLLKNINVNNTARRWSSGMITMKGMRK